MGCTQACAYGDAMEDQPEDDQLSIKMSITSVAVVCWNRSLGTSLYRIESVRIF